VAAAMGHILFTELDLYTSRAVASSRSKTCTKCGAGRLKILKNHDGIGNTE
jgi:hypothetical protein